MASSVVACAVALGFPTAPAALAQASPTVVVSGLDAPRGMAFGPNGELYVAEAGRGGDEQIAWAPPFGFARIGPSARITRIVGGQKTVVAGSLQSAALGPQGEMTGLSDLAFIGSTLYATAGLMQRVPGAPELQVGVYRVTPNGSLERVADLAGYERANNPDNQAFDSHPFGLTAGPDGNLYVADAGANAVLRVTPAGQISTVNAWRTNPVPTGVAFDSGGRAHVSFLSPNPFTPGLAAVERLTPSGSEVVVPNLSTAVDLTFGPDGALYVAEFASRSAPTDPSPPRWLERTGRVLRVTPSGTEALASGLNFPTKLAFGPDGALYVAASSAFTPPGSGEILRLTPSRPAAAAPAPAQPSRPAAAPPAQVPSRLPRTGAAGGSEALAFGGLALALIGAGLRRRRAGRLAG